MRQNAFAAGALETGPTDPPDPRPPIAGRKGRQKTTRRLNGKGMGKGGNGIGKVKEETCKKAGEERREEFLPAHF